MQPRPNVFTVLFTSFESIWDLSVQTSQFVLKLRLKSVKREHEPTSGLTEVIKEECRFKALQHFRSFFRPGGYIHPHLF